MTFATEEVEGESYLGFDFGTSTSACSFIDSRNIQIVERQPKSTGWRELSDLIGELPYPCAARYMSEMDQERRLHRGRDAAEALLTLAAYISFMEMCAQSSQRSSYFKGFAHRSAGPLWALCKQCLQNLGKTVSFSAPLIPLVSQGTAERMNYWVSQIPDTKHARSVEIDYVSFLALLGNQIAKVFSERVFGVFENVTLKKFAPGRFRGIFRDLRGNSQTFIHVLEYEGPISFSDANVYIVHPQTGTALNLSPMYFWGLNNVENPTEDADLYEFDNTTKEGFLYKAVQLREAKMIDGKGDLEQIWRILTDMRVEDPRFSISDGLSLSREGTGT